MCVYKWVRMCVRARTRMHVVVGACFEYANTYIHTYVHAYSVCVYVYTYIHTYIHTYMSMN